MRFLTFVWYLFAIIGMMYNVSMVIWMFIWPHGMHSTGYYFVDMLTNATKDNAELVAWIATITPQGSLNAYNTWAFILRQLFWSAAALHAFNLWLICVKFFTLRRPCAWWTTNTVQIIINAGLGGLHIAMASCGIRWMGIWAAFALFSFVVGIISYCFPWGQMRCHCGRAMYAPEPYMVYPQGVQETQMQQQVIDRGIISEKVIAE